MITRQTTGSYHGTSRMSNHQSRDERAGILIMMSTSVVVILALAWGASAFSPAAAGFGKQRAVNSGLRRVGAQGHTNPVEWDLELDSPSKINLFLRIMGKRPDGYFFHIICWGSPSNIDVHGSFSLMLHLSCPFHRRSPSYRPF